jgi:hypothetical protein
MGRWLGQALCFLAFMAFVGVLSNSPSYRHLEADTATIKLSLRHAGQILGECRQRTTAELADLPANMRIAEICPRERSPLQLELLIDGVLVLSRMLPARGIHSDGRASAYERLSVPAGEIQLTVRLKDHIEAADFHYTASRRLNLGPGANLVIDFNVQAREFEFLWPESDQGAALQNALNDLETDHGQNEDHHEEDDTAIRQRLTSALLDQFNDPVGEEVQPHGYQGE